jgi:hypothetical protein
MNARPANSAPGVCDSETAFSTKEDAMRLLNWLACMITGHQPRYFQAQVIKNGQWRNENRESCTRCGSSDSQRIHTPGLLEFGLL